MYSVHCMVYYLQCEVCSVYCAKCSVQSGPSSLEHLEPTTLFFCKDSFFHLICLHLTAPFKPMLTYFEKSLTWLKKKKIIIFFVFWLCPFWKFYIIFRTVLKISPFFSFFFYHNFFSSFSFFPFIPFFIPLTIFLFFILYPIVCHWFAHHKLVFLW